MITHHLGALRRFHHLALCCWLFLMVWGAAGATGVADEQAGLHRAALVVRYSDNNVHTSCVSFAEPEITGEELLQRSGLVVLLDFNAGLGGAVCSINGQGCSYPGQDCFCQCLGSQCQYWAYYHWENGAWQYASTGASQYSVTDGALEGWSWGQGNFVTGVEPPQITFDEVCAAASTATPTATATATATASSGAQVSQRPQMTFSATTTRVTPGSCAVLSWLTWDADRVTLDGAEVIAQDRREVCPQATQRYVLAAANSAGQTVQEITVQVVGASVPTAGTSAAATATPVPIVPAPPAQGTAAPTSLAPVDPATPLGFDGARVVEMTVTPAAQPTQAISLPLLPTATPHPRRTLGADGRPTPTPILVARAQAGAESAGGAAAAAPDLAGGEADGRGFTLALLPGYASYLGMVAALIATGGWLAQRRAKPAAPGGRKARASRG